MVRLGEEPVVEDGIDAGLTADFNVERAVVVLQLHADVVGLAVDGHKGAERIVQCSVIPVALHLVHEVFHVDESLRADLVPQLAQMSVPVLTVQTRFDSVLQRRRQLSHRGFDARLRHPKLLFVVLRQAQEFEQ